MSQYRKLITEIVDRLLEEPDFDEKDHPRGNDGKFASGGGGGGGKTDDEIHKRARWVGAGEKYSSKGTAATTKLKSSERSATSAEDDTHHYHKSADNAGIGDEKDLHKRMMAKDGHLTLGTQEKGMYVSHTGKRGYPDGGHVSNHAAAAYLKKHKGKVHATIDGNGDVSIWHHKKLDGKGYDPKHFKAHSKIKIHGQEIPVHDLTKEGEGWYDIGKKS